MQTSRSNHFYTLVIVAITDIYFIWPLITLNIHLTVSPNFTPLSVEAEPEVEGTE